MMKRNFSYIDLTVKTPLKAQVMKQWFDTIHDTGPDGIIASAAIVVKNENKNVSFIHEVTGEEHCYIAVLSRDLSVAEVQKIVIAWNKVWPDGDFKIEFSQNQVSSEDSEEDETNGVDAVMETAAKLYHNKWAQEQQRQGWRFATKLSRKEKTHPMLVPWDQLSEQYKTQGRDTVSCVLEAIKDLGFVIKKKKTK